MCSDPRRFRGLVLVLLGGAVVEAEVAAEAGEAMAVMVLRAPPAGRFTLNVMATITVLAGLRQHGETAQAGFGT